MKIAFFLGVALTYWVATAKDGLASVSAEVYLAAAVGILGSRSIGDKLSILLAAIYISVATIAYSIIFDTYNVKCSWEGCGTIMIRDNSYDLNRYYNGLKYQLKHVLEDPLRAPISDYGPVYNFKKSPDIAKSLRFQFLQTYIENQRYQVSQA